jgi:IS605 OrfB family transposase
MLPVLTYALFRDTKCERATRRRSSDALLIETEKGSLRPSMSFTTFRYRVKDATTGKHLARHAWACNQCWNFCCATQRESQRRYAMGLAVRWPTAFDLIKLTTGVAAELGLHSDTVSAICRQFVVSRDAKRKCPRFRASGGAKRALGWIPFIPRAVRIDGNAAVYLKRRFRFWKSREIEGDLRAGSFSQDARGRWYVSFQCEVADDLPTGDSEVGIDLGLKTLATCSDGTTIAALRHYRQYEAALGKSQRAGDKRRVRAIHAKIANCRRHQHHIESTRLVRANRRIFVGNVSASNLARTKMAKSVLDAGWSSFRHMLAYKAKRHGCEYVEVDEAFTTQTCSECGSLGGPRGLKGLGVRAWDCIECGTSHDRDVNSARLILRSGRNVALHLTESRLL